MLNTIITLILTLSSIGADYSLHLAPTENKIPAVLTYYNIQSIDRVITCHEYVYVQYDNGKEPELLYDVYYQLETDDVIVLLNQMDCNQYVYTLSKVEVSNYFHHYPKE